MDKTEMSIRDAEKQTAQINERHAREEKARPDLLHRALIFLIRECRQNNPDAARECDYYRQLLDEELGDTEEIAATETPATPAAAPAPAAAAPAATPDKKPRQSRRFQARQ